MVGSSRKQVGKEERKRGFAMDRMDENLEKLCEENPQELRQVVVTLAEGSHSVNASDLGVAELEEIVGLPGIFKGSLTGEKLLKLCKRSEIEQIIEDIEVSIL